MKKSSASIKTSEVSTLENEHLLNHLVSSMLGLEGLCQKLKVNVETGLNPSDFDERTTFFGNNFRKPLEAKKFCTLFWAALDDFMLKVLLVCAVFSIAFEMGTADADHRKTGKLPPTPVCSDWPACFGCRAEHGPANAAAEAFLKIKINYNRCSLD